MRHRDLVEVLKNKIPDRSLYQKGDLVQFDAIHKYGLVMDIKEVEGFEEWRDDPFVQDVLVLWEDGEEFWCLSFTLMPVTTYNK